MRDKLTHKSIITWPILAANGECNTSEHKHYSEEEAKATCKMYELHGAYDSCENRVFPIETKVEEIK